MNNWVQKAVEQLKKHGHKITPQRLAILETLAKLAPQHPTLTQVYNQITRKYPTISFSTLYTNIQTLQQLGLLHTFTHNGETRLELNTQPHINIISEDHITDLHDPQLIQQLQQKIGAPILLVNIITRNRKTSG